MMVQENSPGTPKGFIRSLRILVAALVIGASVFALITVLINQFNGPVMEKEGLKYNNIFFGVTSGLGTLCLVLANYLYPKKIAKIKNIPASLTDKLNEYRAALISYMAICEMPALLSISIFFLTGDFLVLAVTGVMLAAMLFRWPQKTKLINELALGWKEQQELE